MSRQGTKERLSGVFTAVFGRPEHEGMTDEEVQEQEQEEARAMDIFKTRLNSARVIQSQSYERIPTAHGFDYIEWKPQGYRRRTNPGLQYMRRCTQLAPYVEEVLRSGCVHAAARRWKQLTGKPDDLKEEYER